MQVMFEFLAERKPFDIHTILINLNNDEVAHESVNVFQAQGIQKSLIKGIAGSSAFDNKFRKKGMTITIKTNASVSIEGSVVETDTQLFVKILIVFIQPEEINDAFSYELGTRPSSLFDKKGLMNEAHKPELKNALLDQLGLSECIMSDILQDTNYVLDGWSLFQRLPWTVGSTFDEICQSFKKYLLNKYGTTENITGQRTDELGRARKKNSTIPP